MEYKPARFFPRRDPIMPPLRPYREPDEPADQSSHLLPFSSHRAAEQRWVNVRAVVEDVLEMLSQQMRTQRVHAEVDVPDNQRVWTDESALRSCVWHLALNALEAMPKGGELDITSYSTAQRFELEIADSGRGISDEFRRRIANPQIFESDNSIGHGLNSTLRLAAAHGGEVTARNCPEGGAAFTIRLPNRALRAAA
jgi:signal transduction histidine kinase